MKSTITVIDFGTSKVVALVAEVSGRQRCDITGAGIAPYDGFADARWNNPDLVNDTIAQAIRTAEEQARTNTRDIFVGVPGQFSRKPGTVFITDGRGQNLGTGNQDPGPYLTPRVAA